MLRTGDNQRPAPQWWLNALASGILVVGCGAEPGASVSVRDSGRVRIVHHSATTSTSSLHWRVDSMPRVVIDDEDVADGLFRVAGATRLEDGRIVVANAGTLQLRFFDASGVHLFDAGRRGAGPGEFARMGQLVRTVGDRMVILDRSKAIWYDADGRYLKEVSINLAAIDSGPLGSEDWMLAPDGTFLLRVHHRGAGAGPRVGRQPFGLLRFVPETGAKRLIGWFLGPAWTGEEMGRLTLFSPDTHIGFGPDRIYVGDGATYEIRVYTLEGDLVTLIRRDIEAIEVSADHVSAWKRSYVERDQDPQRRRESEMLVRHWPVSDQFPLFDKLIGDAAGNVWVRRFRPPGDRSRVWTVFNSDGRLMGEVTTPPALSVWEIGTDYMLGLERDSLGTERVTIYSWKRTVR